VSTSRLDWFPDVFSEDFSALSGCIDLYVLLTLDVHAVLHCRYLSLRMDGRVRGSGVGYPPWQAFVAQLPPVKGMWSGLLDGMDGRVL
jgi:hypothetical protein